MPTRKQMEKQSIAAAARGNVRAKEIAGRSGPADELPPPEYWRAVLDEVEADRGAPGPFHPGRSGWPTFSDTCCGSPAAAAAAPSRSRKADATRLHGEKAVWKDVGQRLLDNTCQQRTGRHEEDGCWPAFE